VGRRFSEENKMPRCYLCTKKKGKKQGDIVDLDRKIYHALKRKYGKSWSPIGGVLKKKTGNPLE